MKRPSSFPVTRYRLIPSSSRFHRLAGPDGATGSDEGFCPTSHRREGAPSPTGAVYPPAGHRCPGGGTAGGARMPSGRRGPVRPTRGWSHAGRSRGPWRIRDRGRVGRPEDEPTAGLAPTGAPPATRSRRSRGAGGSGARATRTPRPSRRPRSSSTRGAGRGHASRRRCRLSGTSRRWCLSQRSNDSGRPSFARGRTRAERGDVGDGLQRRRSRARVEVR